MKETQDEANFFSLKLWSASSSIPVIKMLAVQAEANISRALSDADRHGAVESGEFPDEQQHEDGRITTFSKEI